jgi:hypothetical protein
MVEETAAQHGWNWAVELVNDPDAVLRESPEIVATADSAVLDRCGRWFNLARAVIDAQCADASIIDLSALETG